MKDPKLWSIFLIIFVNLLGFGIILPLLPYYVESLGAGPITIGLLTSAYSIFQILAAPILGELSDKFGRRPILLISIFGTAVSFLLLGFANSIPMLFIARILDGVTGGNISTAQAYIADVTKNEDRTQGMGMMMAAVSLGFVIGPALGGLLSVYGYNVPAFVAAGVAFVAVICTYFFLPESIHLKPAEQAHIHTKRRFFKPSDFFDALNHPEVGTLLSISFMTMFSFSLLQGTFALYTEHTFQLGARTNGLIFAYLGFIGIIVQIFLLKKILRLIPEHKLIIISIVFMALGLSVIALSSTVWMLFLAITILALANGLSGPVITGHISKKVSDEEQGSIAGMNQSVSGVARLIGPLLGTFSYSQLGTKSPYIIATGLLSITALYGLKKFNIPSKLM